jgi:hypothetical protein
MAWVQVEKLPAKVKSGVSKAEAEEIEKKLVAGEAPFQSQKCFAEHRKCHCLLCACAHTAQSLVRAKRESREWRRGLQQGTIVGTHARLPRCSCRCVGYVDRIAWS